MKTSNLLLSFVFFSLALLALPGHSVLAAHPEKARLSVSPEHARLIRLLGVKEAAAAEKPSLSISGFNNIKKDVSPLFLRQRNMGEQGKSGETAGPERVYLAPGVEERKLILEGLSRDLRTRPVSPQGADLPFLQELNRLAAELSGRSPSLASTGEDQWEPNKTETEPNDSWVQAQNLDYGDIVAGAALPETDFDIYSFQGEAGDFVKIEVLLDSSTGWAMAQLFDPDSNLVPGGFYNLKEYPGSPENSSFAPIIWPGGNIIGTTLEGEGTYYIVVSTLSGDIIFLDGSADTLYGGETSDEVSYILKLENLPVLPVSGRVIDDHGLAVAGAELNFWSYDGLGGVRSGSVEDGSFNLALPEGTYSVAVKSPPASRYPDNQIVETFTVESSGAELEFILKAGLIFSGRTLDDRGEVVGNIRFNLIDREKGQYRWGYSAEDGAFSMAVFPGTFDIYISAPPQYPPQPVIRGVKIEEDTGYDLILDTGSRVSGKVLDPDGSPLARIRLTFRGERDTRYAVSDENGAYLIALAAGEYWIEVRPDPGLLLPDQMVGPLGVREDLAYDIRLVAGGVLSGSVIDSRGNPVQNALINIWPTYTDPDPEDPADSIKTDDRILYIDESGVVVGSTDSVNTDLTLISKPVYWNGSKRTWTDEEGNWRTALISGEYTVEVTAPADYPPQGVRAGTFYVEEGGTVEVGQVVIDHGVIFSGRVLLPDGSPLRYGFFYMAHSFIESEKEIYGGSIVETQEIAWRNNWVYLDEDGAFSVRLLAGIYDLYFERAPGGDGYPAQRVEQVNLESDLEMTITLQPGHLLSGRVTDPAGNGIEGNYLNFYSKEGAWHGSAYSDRDGAFSVRLVSGDYVVAISPAAGFFPDSARLAFSLTGDQTLDLLLRPGVRVYGRVTDSAGRGIGKVMVHLIRHYETAEDSLPDILTVLPGILGGPVRSDQAGDAVPFVPSNDAGIPVPLDYIIGEEPGITLPLWGSLDFYAWTDESGYWEVVVKADVYDIYAYSSQPGYNKTFVSAVDCTGQREINLTLEQAEILVNGRVEDEQGRPVPGALISLLNPTTGGCVASYTNESGDFELELARGTYELYVSEGEDTGGSSVTAIVELDSDRNMNVRLGEGILDSNGEKAFLRSLYKAYLVGGNHPNPFNPSTTISYAVEQQSHVRLSVFDLRGRRVATLADRLHSQGVYHVQWNGTDSSGRVLASGVYFYRMEAGNYAVTRKMILLK